MTSEVVFTRAGSVAEVIERLVQATSTSVDAALYRFNSARLACVLEDALRRGVSLRLVLDHGKYEESPATRQLLAGGRIPCRLLRGRQGPGSKMHHKFVILDARMVLTGSYNWTVESEELNYENLVVLRDSQSVRNYAQEFEALWAEAAEVGQS